MPLPRLSRRTAHIQPFQTMELMKRAQLLERAGKHVLHMSIGEPDFTAPPPVIDALERAARAGRTQYTSATGIAPLREAIARHYGERYGLDISPSRIVVTAGASAALTLACCALVNPGERVLMTDPSYPCNRHFVASYDGIPELVAVGPETRFQMTRALLERHWRDGVVGTLLASPANPTGTSIAFDEMAGIVDAVRARGGFTIVDEIYLGLSYNGKPRSALELGDDIIVTNSFSKYFHMTGWRLGWLVVPPALEATFEKLSQNLYICASALAQQAALACFTPEAGAEFERRREEFRQRRDFIVTNSFSKYFHMTGWRLGWLVVPPALEATFEKLSQNLYICASALAQQAALACFTPEAGAEFERRREEFRQRRDFIVPALAQIGFEVPAPPDGAFYVYVDCSRFSADSGAFAEELLQHALVSVVPGADFGSHEHLRYLRISYATPIEKIREALGRISDYLAARPAA